MGGCGTHRSLLPSAAPFNPATEAEMNKAWATTLAWATLIPAVAAYGQEHHRGRPGAPPTSQPTTAAAAPVADAKDLSVTHGTVTRNGQAVAYRATAGLMAMKDEAGKVKANIFFVGYDTEAADTQDRPLTFLFNGGPGAAAVWLHLGGCGPKVVQLDPKGVPVGPPYRLVDNPATWLGGSDLVFVDPVGTGYSRAAPGEDAHQFFGYENDLQSTADFVRAYLTKYRRWGSPIYLAGESYGTTRCAGLAGYLADRYGIAVNGVTLMSSVLDFSTLQASPGNDLPYEMYLPSYAAVAWYHRRLGAAYQADLQKTIAAARAFATDEYLPALNKGDALPAAERARVIGQLAALTGIPADTWDRGGLRVGPAEFEKQLLGDGRHIIGRFDGRSTGYDPAGNGTSPSFDPSLSYYLPAYASAFNRYVRETLKYENDVPYEVLSDQVQPWPMSQGGQGPLYVTDDLQEALLEHPRLRVQFVSGYFDLATPFFSADYTVDRMELDAAARARVSHLYFPSGHMIYHNRAAAIDLAAAMDGFVGTGPTTRPATQP
jgi:carboxypeptidase C (cathepsin A)